MGLTLLPPDKSPTKWKFKLLVLHIIEKPCSSINYTIPIAFLFVISLHQQQYHSFRHISIHCRILADYNMLILSYWILLANIVDFPMVINCERQAMKISWAAVVWPTPQPSLVLLEITYSVRGRAEGDLGDSEYCNSLIENSFIAVKLSKALLEAHRAQLERG